MRPNIRSRRRGFTLVEMLVVLGLNLLLITLALALVPAINDKRAAARCADQLQGWLLIAKQRAMRDQAPRGLRLIPESPTSGFVRALEYVEQPPDLLPYVYNTA